MEIFEARKRRCTAEVYITEGRERQRERERERERERGRERKGKPAK